MVYALVSDHLGLKFWMVAYGWFDCSIICIALSISSHHVWFCDNFALNQTKLH